MFDEAGDIDAGRALAHARPETIAFMIGKKQLYTGPPRPVHTFRHGGDRHALGHCGGAGGHQAVEPLYFHDTDKTGGKGLQILIVTEGRDKFPFHPGGFENGCPPFDLDLYSI
jgi:hypothetical protein